MKIMSNFSDLFTPPKKLIIQVFGKKYFYNDYISIISTKDALMWREWLIKTFHKKDIIPDGKWFFLYQESRYSSYVIGIIENSSDGSRVFPFSLFIVCKRYPSDIIFLWDELCNIWEEQKKFSSYDSIYNYLRTQTIFQGLKENIPKSNAQLTNKEQMKSFFSKRTFLYPKLFVSKGIMSSNFFIADKNFSKEDIFKMWKELNHEHL